MYNQSSIQLNLRSEIMCDTMVAKELFKQGMQQVKQNKMKEAIQSFIQFTRENPESNLADNAYYNLGICYKRLDDYIKAIVFFRIVLLQYPDSDAAPMAKDQLEDLQNLMDPAAEVFVRAEQAMIDGDLDSAWVDFSKLTDKFPNSTLADNALLSLGLIARKKGNHDMAHQIFNRLSQQYPDSDAALLLNEIT